MQYSHTFFALSLLSAATVYASPLPLNINMGAYSPALVVGDGAIGFKGAENVAQIMNTLQGAAATASGATKAVPETVPAAGAAAPAAEGTTQAAGLDTLLPNGMGKIVQSKRDTQYDAAGAEIEADYDSEGNEIEVEKRSVERREPQSAGFTAALNYRSCNNLA